jgi:hypothetical protein
MILPSKFNVKLPKKIRFRDFGQGGVIFSQGGGGGSTNTLPTPCGHVRLGLLFKILFSSNLQITISSLYIKQSSGIEAAEGHKTIRPSGNSASASASATPTAAVKAWPTAKLQM